MLAAGKPGFIGWYYGINRPNSGSVENLHVAPGSPLDGIDFSLQPEPDIAQMASAALTEAHPDLRRNLGFDDGRFSPDGSEFAFGVNNIRTGGADEIWLYDLHTERLRRVADRPGPYIWAADGKLYAWFVSDRKRYVVVRSAGIPKPSIIANRSWELGTFLLNPAREQVLYPETGWFGSIVTYNLRTGQSLGARFHSPPMNSSPPVLLVHGIDDTELLFARMRPHLERHGHTVHTINLHPNNGAAGLAELARQIDQFVGARRMDIVAFSMGGIVARYYIQRLGGIERVRRFVTISSPHNGTWSAYLRANQGARELRPASAFLRDLNRDAQSLERVRFTSIWTPLDLMILPARSSALPVARSHTVNVVLHPWMVRDRRVLALVLEALDSEPHARPG